jgi:hypothetical protein
MPGSDDVAFHPLFGGVVMTAWRNCGAVLRIAAFRRWGGGRWLRLRFLQEQVNYIVLGNPVDIA